LLLVWRMVGLGYGVVIVGQYLIKEDFIKKLSQVLSVEAIS